MSANNECVKCLSLKVIDKGDIYFCEDCSYIFYKGSCPTCKNGLFEKIGFNSFECIGCFSTFDMDYEFNFKYIDFIMNQQDEKNKKVGIEVKKYSKEWFEVNSEW